LPPNNISMDGAQATSVARLSDVHFSQSLFHQTRPTLTIVLFILGTRPEAIKLAPVIRHLRLRGATPRVLFTAQHRTLASDVLDYFGVVPDHDLNVMTEGQSISGVAARVLEGIDPILVAESPPLVVVQGDTTTAMAAALAAFHRRIPVAHVEAGLRSGVIDDPFPEEMNRRLISRLASLHCAPTERNRQHLLDEGVDESAVRVTGNTVVDALQSIMDDPRPDLLPPVAAEIAERGHRMIVLTTHRRENFGAGQQAIFEAVGDLVAEISDIEIVFPMHPNPEVTSAASAHLVVHPRVHRVAPMPYPSFVHLLARSWVVLTDSGGLQEEAPALGVPTLVVRRTTERPELIESGSGLLVGVDRKTIATEVRRLVVDADRYEAMAQTRFPFGTGGAVERVADLLTVVAQGGLR